MGEAVELGLAIRCGSNQLCRSDQIRSDQIRSDHA
jgi:hypothetical protein